MINLSVDGISDAAETLQELITPWRRKNAQLRAKLENAVTQAEIKRLNGEALLAQAKANRERASLELDTRQTELLASQAKKIEAEAELLLAQAEKVRVEVEKERALLRQSQIELALKIMERYAPNLSETQKLDYVIRLLPVLDRLISSNVVPS